MATQGSRRVVWTAPGVVAMDDFAPRQPQKGEVLVESDVSLISPGTERAFLLNMENAQGTFPKTGGYSVVGRVVAHGSGVSAPAIGERVVCAAPHMSHVVVDADACVEVPEEVSSEEAAFFNLGTIALQGIRKASVDLGEGVVVLGAGLIGLLSMEIARLSGGMPVVAVDK